MARIVLGNRDGVLALHQARAVLQQLTAEWPDVHLVLKTLPNSAPAADGTPADSLLDALANGTIGVAIAQAETLPVTLPDGVAIAAVTRRLEPRCALLTRSHNGLADLPAGAQVGVSVQRDGAFLAASRHDLALRKVEGALDDQLALLTTGELLALVTPAAPLLALGQRHRVKALLEPSVIPPAVGQGATALLVRSDDDPAFEIAYSQQHRPSFDRLRAERSFAEALGAGRDSLLAGALATVTDEGELTLFGAAVLGDRWVQATVKGDAREAAALGTNLGTDLRERLGAP